MRLRLVIGASQFRAAGTHLELPASDVVLELPDTPAKTQKGSQETKNRANYGSDDYRDVSDEAVDQGRSCRSSEGVSKCV